MLYYMQFIDVIAMGFERDATDIDKNTVYSS